MTFTEANPREGRVVAGSKARLLVIDDDQLMRKLLTRILSSKGYDTTAAHDGAHARELLANHQYDLVLTDLHMPKVDGIAVLRQVREQDPDLPVILFTASPSAESAIGALQLRATAYLTKPIDPGRLLGEVEKALKMHDLARVRKEAHRLVQGEAAGVAARSAAESQFDRAVDGLFMVYQPIVRWSDRSVFGYEALVRSSEPALPHATALFDAAERLRRWNDLGRRIRSKSVEALSKAAPPVSLFINLHARELLDETLYDRASELSRNATRVVLEITERAHLDTVPDAGSRVERLRAMGFRVAIDDIGAGYSGLNSFTMLKPDLIKLDLVLVRDIDSDPVKRRLGTLLTQLCSDLGISVIAEGVETVAERETLLSIGCDMLQGHLFGKPSTSLAVPTFEA
jgi:EAL domain-containing protein (putative c-di-GMP-specific phosphodiesterase class I)